MEHSVHPLPRLTGGGEKMEEEKTTEMRQTTLWEFLPGNGRQTTLEEFGVRRTANTH